MDLKEFIKKHLNETITTCHFLTRLEDRVWGDKVDGPATINTKAYTGEDVASIIDLKSCDDKTKRSYIAREIPLTKYARMIIDTINVLEKDINFDTKYAIGLILWKSSTTYTGRGQSPAGNTLVAVMRQNTLTTLQWQPASDVHSGRVTGTDLILYAKDIIHYARESGKSRITDIDIDNIKTPKKTSNIKMGKGEEEFVIIFNGVKYIIDMKTGDLIKKNDKNKVIKFDDLDSQEQERILSLVN